MPIPWQEVGTAGPPFSCGLESTEAWSDSGSKESGSCDSRSPADLPDRHGARGFSDQRTRATQGMKHSWVRTHTNPEPYNVSISRGLPGMASITITLQYLKDQLDYISAHLIGYGKTFADQLHTPRHRQNRKCHKKSSSGNAQTAGKTLITIADFNRLPMIFQVSTNPGRSRPAVSKTPSRKRTIATGVHKTIVQSVASQNGSLRNEP